MIYPHHGQQLVLLGNYWKASVAINYLGIIIQFRQLWGFKGYHQTTQLKFNVLHVCAAVAYPANLRTSVPAFSLLLHVLCPVTYHYFMVVYGDITVMTLVCTSTSYLITHTLQLCIIIVSIRLFGCIIIITIYTVYRSYYSSRPSGPTRGAAWSLLRLCYRSRHRSYLVHTYDMIWCE